MSDRTLWRYVISFGPAVAAYLLHHWRLSRAYDGMMRAVRGHGGFTGIDRKGYPFMFIWRGKARP